jgi:hypothetical protein
MKCDSVATAMHPTKHYERCISKLSIFYIRRHNNKLNSVAVFRKRTIPTERPPLVGEVSANLCE